MRDTDAIYQHITEALSLSRKVSFCFLIQDFQFYAWKSASTLLGLIGVSGQ